MKILKGLDIGKANGPDGVTNRLLRETVSEIALPLKNYLTNPSSWAKSLLLGRNLIFVRFTKKTTKQRYLIVGLLHYCPAQERLKRG